MWELEHSRNRGSCDPYLIFGGPKGESNNSPGIVQSSVISSQKFEFYCFLILKFELRLTLYHVLYIILSERLQTDKIGEWASTLNGDSNFMGSLGIMRKPYPENFSPNPLF